MTTNAYNTGRTYISSSGRNRIINGACLVAQRGSVTFTTGAGGYGGPDRFVAANAGSAGGQFTQSQGSITYGGISRPAVTQTVVSAIISTSGSNYWGGISQRIEGYNCYDFLGQNVTISFIFGTNVSGTYALAIRDSSSSNSYVTTFTAVANTPQYYTFTVPFPTSISIPISNGTGILLNIGALNQSGTFATSTFNTWQASNYIGASTQTNWAATASNYISIAEFQVEPGGIATPFERRNYAIELLNCYRYYQAINVIEMNAITFTANGDTRFDIPFRCPMRIAPTTATFSNSSFSVIGSGLSGYVTNVIIPIAFAGATVDSMFITTGSSSNLTPAGPIAFWGSGTSPIIAVTAEL